MAKKKNKVIFADPCNTIANGNRARGHSRVKCVRPERPNVRGSFPIVLYAAVVRCGERFRNKSGEQFVFCHCPLPLPIRPHQRFNAAQIFKPISIRSGLIRRVTVYGPVRWARVATASFIVDWKHDTFSTGIIDAIRARFRNRVTYKKLPKPANSFINRDLSRPGARHKRTVGITENLWFHTVSHIQTRHWSFRVSEDGDHNYRIVRAVWVRLINGRFPSPRRINFAGDRNLACRKISLDHCFHGYGVTIKTKNQSLFTK